jgi:hypothetical protein
MTKLKNFEEMLKWKNCHDDRAKSLPINHIEERTVTQEDLPITNEKPNHQCPALLKSVGTAYFEVQQIPIDLIDYDKSHVRSDPRNKSIKRLEASMKKNGLLQPITVLPAGERYTIVFGLRRLVACILIDLKTIPAIVLPENIAPQDLCAYRIFENMNRENFKPLSLATEISNYLKLLQPALDDMAVINLFNNYERQSKSHNESEVIVTSILEITGLSAGTFKNYLNLLRLPPEVKAAIDANKLKATVGYVLATRDGDANFNAICKKAVDEKLSKKAVKDLFNDHVTIHDDSEDGSAHARRFLKQLNELMAEFNASSDCIPYDDAIALMEALNDIQSVVGRSLPSDMQKTRNVKTKLNS